MDSSSPNVLHGVFLCVSDIGILITGESGAGKSDLALELVSRGHKLIADDIVEVQRFGKDIFGRSPERFAGLLAVRDLGIIDVRQIIGQHSFEPIHKIELCIEFQDIAEWTAVERFSATEILGVKIPTYVLPVPRGRNLHLLAETAVKLSNVIGTSAEERLLAAHDRLVSA